MNDIDKNPPFPYAWFKWVPFTILIIAALTPALFMISGYLADVKERTWDPTEIGISLMLMIVPAISLFSPFIILGFMAEAFIIILYGFAASVSGGLNNLGQTFLSTITMLFLIGSSLLIVYGISFRSWRRSLARKAE